MSHNVEMPSLGESVTEATLLTWLKKEGDRVKVDEPLCELESDKATVDLPSPESGVLHQIKKAGETAHVGEVIARIDPVAADGEPAAKVSAARNEKPSAPAEPKEKAKTPAEAPRATQSEAGKATRKVAPPPGETTPTKEEAPKGPQSQPAAAATAESEPRKLSGAADASVRRVPMSKVRRSIAERLVRAQQTTAMLTTFNEIDMTAVQEVRQRNQEEFKKAHGVSLGLMSFFARASVLALKHHPALNARIEGSDIVYFDHVHLGIAVSTERGLVVPVLRDAESMSFAKIEQEIKRAATAARDGKLSIQELSGGTFTITNGGVFGSLLSTPILNPPQTGILGMHAIQDRPVAIKGEVQIRPMMYIALTYDHRLVDGSDAVSFLVRLKQLLEDPLQMILEI
jgi:2-oxoglutarate dehydrogenase E2 component (dihydrolipoamide succinyltransferase)